MGGDKFSVRPIYFPFSSMPSKDGWHLFSGLVFFDAVDLEVPRDVTREVTHDASDSFRPGFLRCRRASAVRSPSPRPGTPARRPRSETQKASDPLAERVARRGARRGQAAGTACRSSQQRGASLLRQQRAPPADKACSQTTVRDSESSRRPP